MKTTYIFLSDSVEEIEALAAIDILRRAQVPIISVSMNETLTVLSSHGVTIAADVLFAECDFSDADYLILPGGSTRLNDYDELKSLLVAHNQRGGRLAAICAAPMVLGGLGLLDGKRATCYPGFEGMLGSATFVAEPVVVDGSTITANGAGSAMAFGYALVEQICGEQRSVEIQQQMMFK
ncbi:MAG: DJ-1 family glyoxalase III [Rikenellaceae bacterium]